MTEKAVTRRRVAFGVIVGVLVIAVGVVALLGGFQHRKADSVAVPLGQEIDTGMMVYLPESATVQFKTESDTAPWEVIITMKVRNPQAESLQPVNTASPNVLGGDPNTGAIANPKRVLLGATPPGDSVFSQSPRGFVPPDNRWMEMRLVVNPAPSYVPGSTYIAVFRPMKYSASTAYGYSSDKSWRINSQSRALTVAVPLTRLPDGSY
ncbi:MAG: hypothetical protein FWD63_04225 [Propionibacteriaceae bacterium]|nr:hypothetical protein [Propionibacteriaceae bacterium]